MQVSFSEIRAEPYWWLRLLESALGVLTFVFLLSFQLCGKIKIDCYKTGVTIDEPLEICVQFPFQLSEQTVTDLCHERDEIDYIMHVDYDAPAIFFLLIIALSTAYSIFVFVMYLMQWERYNRDTYYVFPDLLLTFTYSAYWLAATSGFISALIAMKMYTGDEQMKVALAQLSTCNDGADCDVDPNQWSQWHGLNIACVLGVVETLVWAANAFLIMRKLQIIKIAETRRYDEVMAQEVMAPSEDDMLFKTNRYGALK